MHQIKNGGELYWSAEEVGWLCGLVLISLTVSHIPPFPPRPERAPQTGHSGATEARHSRQAAQRVSPSVADSVLGRPLYPILRSDLELCCCPGGVGVVVASRAETLVPAAKQTGYECEEATHSARCYSNYFPQREGERGCAWCWLE